jgi:putative sterol carrier protein
VAKVYNLDDVFATIERRLNDNPKPIESVNAVYQFELHGEGEQTYQLHLHEGRALIKHGVSSKADCRIKMKEEDFMNMLFGKLNGISAFMTGKLKVNGSMDLAMRLQKVLGAYAE